VLSFFYVMRFGDVFLFVSEPEVIYIVSQGVDYLPFIIADLIFKLHQLRVMVIPFQIP